MHTLKARRSQGTKPAGPSRRLPPLLAAACALWLATGCGPGVGGSGTGQTEDALAAFGAQSASVCGGDLAPLLACSPGTVSAPPVSAPVYLADTIDGRRVLVTVRGNGIELQAPCAQIKFRGEWGAVAGQAARYFGFTDPDGAPTPATVQVQASGSGVLLTARDGSGRVLLGPVLVAVVAAPSTPGSCS